jgi:hypothetical protein
VATNFAYVGQNKPFIACLIGPWFLSVHKMLAAACQSAARSRRECLCELRQTHVAPFLMALKSYGREQYGLLLWLWCVAGGRRARSPKASVEKLHLRRPYLTYTQPMTFELKFKPSMSGCAML